MNYRSIKDIVKAEFRRVQQEPRLRSAQSYTSCGGGLIKKTWRTAGYFLEVTAENRLVFETLFVPAINVCVVRVYFEQPLKFLYTRKFSTCESIASAALHEASQIYIDSASKIHIPDDASVRMSEMVKKAPKGIRAMLSKAMVPIPPPVDLEKVQEAAPPPARDGVSAAHEE
jgi:hypothetical protein